VPSYRIYFLNSDDHIASTDVLECDADGQAEAVTNPWLLVCGYSVVEVWDRNRMVCRVRKVG
jgi:hypothetical protein